jgi:hypothetical protein
MFFVEATDKVAGFGLPGVEAPKVGLLSSPARLGAEGFRVNVERTVFAWLQSRIGRTVGHRSRHHHHIAGMHLVSLVANPPIQSTLTHETDLNGIGVKVGLVAAGNSDRRYHLVRADHGRERIGRGKCIGIGSSVRSTRHV